MYLEIFILLLLLTIIVVALILFYAHRGSKNIKITNPINRDDLKTGDLVFARYDNSLGYFMRVISGSIWTHVSMVYRDPNNNLYIIETANYPGPAYRGSTTKYKGVLFMPIAEWMQFNKHRDMAVMRLETPPDFNRDILLNEFSKVSHKNLDTISVSWLRLLVKRKYKDYGNIRQNLTCYELMVHLLQQSGIVEKEYMPLSYFPKDIINEKLPLKSGFSYKKLQSLKFK
jgi:hypothetical protein